MVNNSSVRIAYKVILALLGFSALATEISTLIERGLFKPANFFSFFTVESNILVCVMLLLSALAVAAGESERWSGLRGAVTVYILVVGIGFSVLLAGATEIPLTAVPWDNTVLHYIVPVAAGLDYALDRPRRRLSFPKSLAWLAFPILYVAYSLIRGAISGWYPYPFLNPATDGWAAAAVTVAGLLVLSVVLIWGVTRIAGWRRRGPDELDDTRIPQAGVIG